MFIFDVIISEYLLIFINCLKDIFNKPPNKKRCGCGFAALMQANQLNY